MLQSFDAIRPQWPPPVSPSMLSCEYTMVVFARKRHQHDSKFNMTSGTKKYPRMIVIYSNDRFDSFDSPELRVKGRSSEQTRLAMSSFEVEPTPRIRATSPDMPDMPKKSVIDKMRRASMAAYLAQKGVESFASDASKTPSEKEREGITRREAWSNMVLALIGVMVCLLPNIMSKSGYLLAPPMLMLSAAAVVRMGALICQACELVEEINGKDAGSVKSYEDLAKAVGMYKILLVTKNTVTGFRFRNVVEENR